MWDCCHSHPILLCSLVSFQKDVVFRCQLPALKCLLFYSFITTIVNRYSSCFSLSILPVALICPLFGSIVNGMSCAPSNLYVITAFCPLSISFAVTACPI